MSKMTHKDVIDIIDQAAEKAAYKEDTRRMHSLANSMNMDATLLLELQERGVVASSEEIRRVALQMKAAALMLLTEGNARVAKVNGWG